MRSGNDVERINQMTREKYLESKTKLLREFKILVTTEVEWKLSSLYPDAIAIENYIHSLISHKLHEDDKY